jgi:4-aminobutyrate--pyruvate transaminase
MNPNNLSENQKLDVTHLLHPYSQVARLEENGPLIIERGEGCYVFDQSGRPYLEAMSGLWCTSLGFSEKRLVKAATDQMSKLPYYQCFGPRSHQPALELAEALTAVAPDGLDHVLFASSGSEANDSAVKLAWYYHNALGQPGRKKIIARKGSYHGVTVISGSLTGQKRVHLDFDLPIPGILHTDFPSYYHESGPNESLEAFGNRLVKSLEDLILKEGPETVAAFIAEPVIAGSGVILPPPGYFEGVQKVLKKYDILFIVDEVVTGFGRTGKMWGSLLYDLAPDMLSVAKGLSSAYLPISALLYNDRLHEVLKRQSDKLGGFFHGTTYSAHPVAAAVALETLKIYKERKIVERVSLITPYFQKKLSELENLSIISQVRSVGLLAGLEISGKVKNPDPKISLPAWIQNKACQKGLMIRAAGTAVALCPPLIITEKEIDKLFDILKDSLLEAEKFFLPS